MFPVADGDTGDNMVLTLRAVLQELDRLAGASAGAHDRRHRPRRDRRLGRAGGAARRPRQLRRDPLAADPRRRRGAGQPARRARRPGADQRGARARRRPGLRLGPRPGRGDDPHRGPRDGASASPPTWPTSTDARLGPDATAEEQNAVIAEVIERALDAGQESVKRGPDLLPVLREAGVVDAGGYALTVLLAGIVGALRGTEAPRRSSTTPPRGSPIPSTPRPPTATARTSRSPAPRSSSAASSHALEQIGDSVLVVGDPTTLKVHVHTDDPNAATALFAEFGAVSHLDVADMRAQVQRARRAADRAGATPSAVCGALAVVTGDGMRSLFEGLGVRTLEGGPTLNPSTYDLLAAIHAVPAEQVRGAARTAPTW